ncbi:MAG: alanyl-tRNA editing protein [Nanohaloarchaea archaeon SW_7_43_1]|nr:MAG: alanyl-tRNA editing protein [Nanohaloarchaea archaeon SW_7_43_1]
MSGKLYLPDNEYQKEFEAEITKSRETTEVDYDGYICFSETLFYKEGGGQPSDTGTISWGEKESKVVDVQRDHGEIRHYIQGELPEAETEIKGEIDWERRYKHMRMHTAQHVVSWVVLNRYNASTAGNQIHKDYSRIDFEPADFDESDVEKIERSVNTLIERELEVEKKYMSRERVEEAVEEGRTNLDIIPEHVDPLRVVIIGENDLCPCGGTHVDSIDEIGRVNITNRISKGASVERLEFVLEE